MYSDAEAAALYDVMNPWKPESYRSDAFYTRLVMAADSVADFGCGTGSMLHHAREHGHTGRLAGLDPDSAMLGRAQARTDVEWVLGRADMSPWQHEFQLATMASNAFQCLTSEDDVINSLRAIRRSLADGGRFAFETRNPAAQAWLDWNPSNARDVVDANGRTVRVWHEVEEVDGDLVTFTGTTDDGVVLRVDRATLRFLDPERLNAALVKTGFAVENQYGDFTGGALTAESKSIVTLARRV